MHANPPHASRRPLTLPHRHRRHRAVLILPPDVDLNKYYLYLLDEGLTHIAQLRDISYMPPALAEHPVEVTRAALFNVGPTCEGQRGEFSRLLERATFVLMWTEIGATVILHDIENGDGISLNESLMQRGICETIGAP